MVSSYKFFRPSVSLKPFVPEKLILWEPRILGRYKFRWLKIRPRRRAWGLDWWEDDYYFSMEWLSTYDPDTVETETTEYWESLLEDFSRSKRFIVDVKRDRQVPHARVLAYQQPEFFRTFYWQKVTPFIYKVEDALVPIVKSFALAHQELKYTELVPGYTFRRVSRQYIAPREIEEVFEFTPCYTYERADIVETSYDFLCLDTLSGRWSSAYWPRFLLFSMRFCLDFQHVSFVSFWIDILYRGFSVNMLFRRWRRFYFWLAHFAFIDTYITLSVFLLLYLQKRGMFYFFEMSSFGFIVGSLLFIIDCSRSLAPHRRMQDRAPGSDRDVRAKAPDKPRDWLLEEMYEPSDTLHTHINAGFDAGYVGQDELSIGARLSPTGSILLTSWWVEANESLAHFVYMAEREAVLRRRTWLSRKISSWTGYYLPKVKLKLIEWRVPIFKRRIVIRNQFTWWIPWKLHQWFWWGQPQAVYDPKFTRVYWYYELCVGILRYYAEYEEEVLAVQIKDVENQLHDWTNWGLVVEEDRDLRILYGPQVVGYID